MHPASLKIPESALVVGLGISGLWSARWLAEKGSGVTVSDFRPESELDPDMVSEVRELGCILETGEHRIEAFLGKDAIVVSPGVPLDIEPLEKARKMGIPVLGELELASRFIEEPIIAITGTNGKSTVTAMIGEMLKEAGKSVFVGGNIGLPVTAYLGRQIRADFLVVEVSSFQLDTSESFSPYVSIILNISPDHLDRYESYEDYAASKLSIMKNQGPGTWAVLNDDDDRLSSAVSPRGAGIMRYGREERNGRHAFIDRNLVVARTPEGDELTFDCSSFHLTGGHNLENLMAAVVTGLLLEIDQRTLQQVIDTFRGLSHRMELVAESRGIRFFDDSKATNVDAASKAVRSIPGPVILIAGGRHKGFDYGPLADACEGKVKRAVLLGESRQIMAQSFENRVPYSVASGMKEAVSEAVRHAGEGDSILLAPACSSFDMYRDYKERGRDFSNRVKGLTHGG